jgi:hypothetical protein
MHLIEASGSDLDTIGDKLEAVLIGTAAAAFGIQQAAGYAGIKYLQGVLVFEFVQTTQGTAITQSFPFGVRHLGKGFDFPKRFFICFH